MRHLKVLAILSTLFAAGCAAQKPASRTVGVRADGSVVAETRSALSGSTAAGPQELIGLYVPFGPFAVKAGLEWDGTTFIPPIPLATQETFAAADAESPCTTTREVMVEETVMQEERRMVPVKRLVRRTITEPAVKVPLPKAPAPCAPATPKGCSSPPVAENDRPPSETMCFGEGCGVPPQVAAK